MSKNEFKVMKYLFIGWIAVILFMFGSALYNEAMAQEQQVPCFPFDQAITVLEEQYGETLQEEEELGPVTYQLYHNEETGTWTFGVREFNMQDNQFYFCMLGHGVNEFEGEGI